MDAERSHVWREGLVTGVIGYATVAVFYGLLNLVTGQGFFAAAEALGRHVAGTAWTGTGAAWGPVLAYNAIHLLAFLAVGVGATWLLFGAERRPEFWFFFFLVGGGALVFTESLFLLLAVPVTRVLSWGSVAGANAAAALTMGRYLYGAHPDLLWKIEEREESSI